MRKPRPTPLIALIAIMFVFIAGCALVPSSQQDLTPLEIAQAQVQKIMDAYIIVYDKTMAMAKDPTITESEKKLVAANKKVLDKVWPSLKRCLELIGSGKIPSKIDLDTADDVLDLLEGAIQ